MEPEDPSTIIDLRSLNSYAGCTKYEIFWDHAARVINEVQLWMIVIMITWFTWPSVFLYVIFVIK